MVPSTITILQKIPLTANGKIDRKNLPGPDIKAGEGTSDYKPPETELEIQLTKILGQILGFEKIGVYDPFFSIGATSLDMVKFQNQLTRQLKIELSVVDLFEHATVHALSVFISSNSKQVKIGPDIQKKVAARKAAALKKKRNRIKETV
jgi:hypothetical protein